MEIIFSYPFWVIFICLLLGALYAVILYYKNRDFTPELKNLVWVKGTLAVLRWITVSVLAFLLLSPLIKSNHLDKIDPRIVFLQDNSESLKLNLSTEDSSQYQTGIQSLLTVINGKYDLDYYTFDKDLKQDDILNFKGKSTNISNALEQVNGLYYNQNVGAIILASDGIYNQGDNPIYSSYDFPIYALALGDTNQQTDVKIVAVRNNKIAYLDDEIQVEVDLQANHLKEEKYTISLSSKGNVLQSKTLPISEDFDETETNFTIKAEAIGIHQYTLKVKSFEDEISVVNNTFDFFVEVIDNRQKILLVANAPHPDIAAIKSVVELNKNFEIDIQYLNRLQAEFTPYSLVILHQLPSTSLGGQQLLNSVKAAKIPIWFIAGTSSAYKLFNEAQSMLSIDPSAENTNDASPLLNSSFTSFSISDHTAQSLKKFPPIITPFGNYNLGASTSIALKQKIGSIETDFPLLCFQDNFGTRSAAFIGDGLWRWKLHDYLENDSHEAFNEIIEKTFNYLALKGDKRKFRVNTNKNTFFEGEMIQFEAELYNESYELVNDPEVNLIVRNEEGQDFPFTFNKTSKSYQFQTNTLPLGNYSYTAITNFNGTKQTAKGIFSIQAMQLEALQTTANHKLLKKLAQQTDGSFYLLDEINTLQEEIMNLESLKPMLYESVKTQALINLKALFFVILSFLSVEWFARKWMGAY